MGLRNRCCLLFCPKYMINIGQYSQYKSIIYFRNNNKRKKIARYIARKQILVDLEKLKLDFFMPTLLYYCPIVTHFALLLPIYMLTKNRLLLSVVCSKIILEKYFSSLALFYFVLYLIFNALHSIFLFIFITYLSFICYNDCTEKEEKLTLYRVFIKDIHHGKTQT